MSDINSNNDQMLEMFVFEMSSLLENLDNILLESEKNKALTADDVAEVFRIMHTIKGSSAMMEFDSISILTHKLEDSFFIIRENGINSEYFAELFDLMLDATDFLKSQLEAIQNGEKITENNAILERASLFYNKIAGKNSVDAPPQTDVPAKEAAVPEADSPSTYKADVMFDEDCGMENLRALMLINNLNSQCNILSYEPEDIETNPESCSYILHHGFSLTIQSEKDKESLQKIIEECMHVKSVFIKEFGHKDKVSFTGDTNLFKANVMFEDGCGMENLRSFMLLNSLKPFCIIKSFEPADIERSSETSAYIMNNGFCFELECQLTRPQLVDFLEKSMHIKSAVVTQLNQTSPSGELQQGKDTNTADSDNSKNLPDNAESTPIPEPAAPSSSAKSANNKPVKQNIINVNLSKLDALMDLMGELVISESMVTRSPDLRGVAHLDDFNKSSRQLRKLTDELQDMVMSIRMVPIAGTFQKMHRIVRDMCRNLGKEAELVTMGEDTDIDKTIIDGIADPIMHLVRNSMDHGVETPEEREAAGKNRKATITLSAQNTGGEILITISDDGKGLDPDYLVEKAKSKGLISKPSGEYTEKEIYQFLMLPGFSTKEQISEYSGRGVGMDVVKKNIEKVGGSVVIESKKGHGMSNILKIPLTLAIVDGMDVAVGDGVYTIQITSINESFKATAEQVLTDTNGNEMIMIRGSVYPVVRLHQLYNVPNAITDAENGIFVLVNSGDRSACLFVDKLIGEQQIVVKPLPKYLARFDIKPYGISGCTILGDGNISLIIDVASIIDNVLDKR